MENTKMENNKMDILINGGGIKAREGETILTAARRAGVHIPTLCYMEKLLPTGSCRLCVVEVEGHDNPVAACNTPVVAGMRVSTDTQKLKDMRREILSFILMTHPLECDVCELKGLCTLELLAKEYAVEAPASGVTSPRPRTAEFSTPAIIYKPYRCIACGRCVSACQEIVGRGVLALKGEGIGAAMEVVNADKCISCGECLSVCPVAALADANMDKLDEMALMNRGVRPKKTQTVCAYCGVGCTFELNVLDGKVVGVTTNHNIGTNKGSLCIKGRFGYRYINSPDRLTTPLIRKNGELVEASWDEALDLVAGKLSAIKRESGPDSIAGLTSAKCTNEDNYVFQKFMRAAVGTNNVDHCARL